MILTDQDKLDEREGRVFAMLQRYREQGKWSAAVKALRAYRRDRAKERRAIQKQNQALNRWMQTQL